MALSSSPSRPFTDSYLLAYSEEHVSYEVQMFFTMIEIGVKGRVTLGGAPEITPTLSNALLESIVIHLRNLIDFLYPKNPQLTDIVASDFFDPDQWESLRTALTDTLSAARVRANKEMAHLTTDRIFGIPPEKRWDFVGLATELRMVLQIFVKNAKQSRLSPNVALQIL